jgi:hypothetical protein
VRLSNKTVHGGVEGVLSDHARLFVRPAVGVKLAKPTEMKAFEARECMLHE